MVVNRMKLNVKDYKNNEIIRILREYSSMTQKELASKLSKNVRTIQRYESGEANINLELVREICALCDLTITIESKIKQKNQQPKQ